MKFLTTLALLLVCCLTATAIAQLPRIINYQGVLTDAGGAAVGDGTYSVTFRLYMEEAGGTEIWSETQPVTVSKGIFNVDLGTVTPLDLPFEVAHWLGISVEGEAELSPRVRLTTSPYSFNSWGVRGATNLFPADGNVGIGIMEPQHPLHIVTDGMTGLRIDGTLLASWANITLNAEGGASSPSYEYYRQGSYRGRTFLDNGNNWHLQLGGDRMISVMSGTGGVGIGVESPLERLDVNGAIRLGGTDGTSAGTIRWTGSDFEGYNGSAWQSLTATGESLPAGTAGQTLRHNGADWTANSILYNDGTNIGIGTTSPQQKLHVDGLARFDMPDCQVNISTPGGWPGLIVYESIGGKRRDLVFDDTSIWLSASTTSSAPSADNGLTIIEGGNVGIGTFNPLEKLCIYGDGPTYALINAPLGYAPGVMFSVNESIRWRLMYHPGEGTIQFYREGIGPKMVIGDGGRVGIGTTLLGGTEWLEVHNPNPDPGEAAIVGYSYWNTPPSISGGIAVAGIHADDGVGGTGVYGEATDGGQMFDSQIGVYGYTDDGYGVYSDGTLGSTGPVVTLAATRDYGHRKVYAVQSAGNWFEDFGEGRLSGGEAVVEIDPVFAQTVNLGEAYHVFLTPLGDCGLYVAEKTDRHFVVRARDGGRDDITFDYRIVAKRSGFESKRLEPVRDPVEMRRHLGIPRGKVAIRQPEMGTSVR